MSAIAFIVFWVSLLGLVWLVNRWLMKTTTLGAFLRALISFAVGGVGAWFITFVIVLGLIAGQ